MVELTRRGTSPARFQLVFARLLIYVKVNLFFTLPSAKNTVSPPRSGKQVNCKNSFEKTENENLFALCFCHNK